MPQYGLEMKTGLHLWVIQGSCGGWVDSFQWIGRTALQNGIKSIYTYNFKYHFIKDIDKYKIQIIKYKYIIKI